VKKSGAEAGRSSSEHARRFPIRFDRWYAILSTALLLFPSRSFVEVGTDMVRVEMGWGFRARFPPTAIVRAGPLGREAISRGVHGFFGRWLVNGSGDHIVAIDLEPPQPARVTGFPVRLRRLMVSVDDPAALVAALG
jgi:hypothetical protein